MIVDAEVEVFCWENDSGLIRSTLGLDLRLKNRKNLVNAKQAEEYIEKLLKEKNVEDPQFEFYF